MDIPEYAHLETEQEVDYLGGINADKNFNVHHLRERKLLVMRNCDKTGQLIDLKIAVKKQKIVPWILFHIREFTDTTSKRKYEIPICTLCSPVLEKCSQEQSIESLKEMLCLHSKVAGSVVRNFKNPYYLDGWLSIGEYDEVEDDEIKCDIFLMKTTPRSTKSQHLALVAHENKFNILYTVGRQDTPTCTGHFSAKCSCVRFHAAKIEKVTAQNVQSPVPEPEPEQPEEGAESAQNAHYLDQNEEFGYNKSDIFYPINKCPIQNHILKNRGDPIALPANLYPPYQEDEVCQHGNQYSEDLRLVSNWVKVFSLSGVKLYATKVYCRDTTSTSCRCQKHFDGHPLLLYHIQLGTFIDYQMLNEFFLLFCTSGVSAFAYHKSKKMLNPENFDINYQTFNRACDGFVYHMKFDIEKCFTCKVCKTNPHMFVGDGKCDIAPLQRKLRPYDIKELGPHPADENILSQGSHHHDRVFINSKKERDLYEQLLTKDQELTEFCQNNPRNSLLNKNCILMWDICNRLSQKYKYLPNAYSSLFKELTKNTPVAGLLQFTDKKALNALEKFCREEKNIRSVENLNDLKLVTSQIPPFWDILIGICGIENETFLPKDIAKIVLRMIQIRHDTYHNVTPPRYRDDYFPYDEEREQHSAYYPNHKLHTYPKKYKVNSVTTKDMCSKIFTQGKDFADGIFTIGKVRNHEEGPY